MFKTNIYQHNDLIHDNILLWSHIFVTSMLSLTKPVRTGNLRKKIPSILVQSCPKLLLHIIKEFTTFAILSI